MLFFGERWNQYCNDILCVLPHTFFEACDSHGTVHDTSLLGCCVKATVKSYWCSGGVLWLKHKCQAILLASLPVQRVRHPKTLETSYTFHLQWKGIPRALLQTCVNIYSFLVYSMMLSTVTIMCHITVWKVIWKDVIAIVVSSEILSKYLPHGTASNNEEKIPVRIVYFWVKILTQDLPNTTQ